MEKTHEYRVMPPNLPTIVGIAVPTMVVSGAAKNMPNIKAIVTIILAFFVICLFLRQVNDISNNQPHVLNTDFLTYKKMNLFQHPMQCSAKSHCVHFRRPGSP